MPTFTELAAGIDPATNMATPKAQAWVLDQVRSGNHPELQWFNVARTVGEMTIFLVVSNRVRIGDESDSVIPLTSARTEQQIADHFSAYLATPTIFDAIADHADLVSYVSLQKRNVADLSFAQMVAGSREVDERYSGRPDGLREMAKSWMVSAWYNNPQASGLRAGANTGINYGAALRGPAGAGNKHPWPSVSLPGTLRVWQPPGGRGQLFHDLDHTDISQKAPHLVLGVATVKDGDGPPVSMLLEEVARHERYHVLVSSQGPLDSMRIPIAGGSSPGGGGGGPGGGVTPVGNKPKSSAALMGLGLAAVAVTLYLLS